MAKRRASYTLSVLLKLNDRLSGGLNKSVSALKRFEKQSSSAIKAHSQLRKELGRQLPATPLSRYQSQIKSTANDVRALSRDVGRLNAQIKRGGVAPPRPGVTPQPGITPQPLQLAPRPPRPLTDRDRTRAEREQTRLLREQLKLRQDGARLAQIEARTRQTAAAADVRLMREQMRLQRDAQRQRATRAARPGFVDSASNRVMSAAQAGQAIRGAVDTVVDFARPAMQQMRAEARFRVAGYSEDDTARGIAAVNESLTKVRGVTRAEGIETLNALSSTFGDVNEAAKFLPISLRYRANMQTLHGDQYSPADINRQISNSFKALELLGIDRPTGLRGTFTDQDRARMESYFNQVSKATAATGGDINPAEFRAFAKYGGNAAMGLSPAGLSKILPLIQQVGGARLGTSLTSLNQNLVLGQMPAYKLKRWDELGLLDKKKVEFTKAGLIKRMKPGAIPMAETLQSDPMAFAEELNQKLKGRGVDTTDFKKVNEQVGALVANRTSQNLIAQMINFQASLDKEAKNYQRALGVNESYSRLFDAQHPLGNFLSLQTQWNDAKAREAMGLVNRAGGAAGGAADWMQRHPDLTAALTGVTALGKASTEAAGGVSLLRDAMSGLRGGGAGGGVSSGSGFGWTETIGSGYFGYKTLKAAGARGFARLAGRGGLPGAIIAGAAGSTYAIHSNYQTNVAERERARTDAGATYERLKAERAQRGGTLPRETADQFIRQAMPQGPAALLINLEPKVYGGAGYPGVSAPVPHRNEQVIGELRRQMPALELPEVMAAFVRMNRQLATEGKMPRPASERAVSVAQAAFPESFKAAASQLGDEAQKLVQGAGAFNSSLGTLNNYLLNPIPSLTGNTGAAQSQSTTNASAALATLATETPRTTGALGGLVTPADQLRAALARASSGANSFASRVAMWQPPQINITGQVIGQAAQPGPRQPFGPPKVEGYQFSLPKSSAGSVIERDGLVSAHKGNVIFPAKLSRRKPGDWLETARKINDGGRERARRASLETLPKANAVAPMLPRSPRETAAPVDGYSSGYTDLTYAQTDAPHIEIHAPITISGNVDNNNIAEIKQAVREGLAQLADRLSLLERRTSPDAIERRIKHRMGIEEERA
ncbi:MAG TPA: hypothetical protein VIP46_22115 [Pyrinomonadaceae bacterium]